MAKAPAVQFYVSDFLTGTTLMTNEEVGLYIRLLCLQVENGSVPDDAERMSLVYGPSVPKLWKAVRAKFVAGTEPGTMVNVKMSGVLADREAFRQRQSDKGKASAESRLNSGSKKKKPRFNHGSTTVEPLEGEGRDIGIRGKERATEKAELVWPPFAGEKVKAKWAEFIRYRIREKKQRYHSVETEQKALDLAATYFTTGKDFVDALDHTMARTWVFPVDPSEHKYPHMQKVTASTAPAHLKDPNRKINPEWQPLT